MVGIGLVRAYFCYAKIFLTYVANKKRKQAFFFDWLLGESGGTRTLDTGLKRPVL